MYFYNNYPCCTKTHTFNVKLDDNNNNIIRVTKKHTSNVKLDDNYNNIRVGNIGCFKRGLISWYRSPQTEPR